MGNSLLVMGAIMGADVRIAAPKDLWPGRGGVRRWPASARSESGARITLTEDPRRGRQAGADFVHTDVWVSMGEPKEVWDERVKLLTPYQVNAGAHGRHRQPATPSSCTACRPSTTPAPTVGREIAAQLPALTDGLEVTDEVFESRANIAFDQAENRLHTIKAIMVATLAG